MRFLDNLRDYVPMSGNEFPLWMRGDRRPAIYTPERSHDASPLVNRMYRTQRLRVSSIAIPLYTRKYLRMIIPPRA